MAIWKTFQSYFSSIINFIIMETCHLFKLSHGLAGYPEELTALDLNL